jgi:hypothetical protein
MDTTRTPKAPKPSRKRGRKNVQRRARRVDVRVAVRAVLRPLDAEESEVYGWVANLGAGGAAVRTAESLPPETPLDLRLVWKDGPVFRAIFLKGRVVYATPDGMGLAFDAVSPEVHDVLKRLDRRHMDPAA